MQQRFLQLSPVVFEFVRLTSNHSIILDMIKVKSTCFDALIDPKVRKIRNKLLYCDYIENNKLKYGFKKNFRIKCKLKYKFEKELKNDKRVASIVATKLVSKNLCVRKELEYARLHPRFMFKDESNMNICCSNENSTFESIKKQYTLDEKEVKDCISYSNLNSNKKLTNELKLQLLNTTKTYSHWMTDYEVYNDALQTTSHNSKYGTPNPYSQSSSIPCGGCGALLHCKDNNLPGYLPSELYAHSSKDVLKTITCQRCHFMKYYNTCLYVRPSNKIDLLPRDSPHFLDNIRDCLKESIMRTGISKTNIKYIGLISAKTGYGVEELVNKMHTIWQYKGNVYLIGCTNSGKSTLFNTLLHSDFCKAQAVDLTQFATTSYWPGTTLNLLKFPIFKPTSQRIFERMKRLLSDRKKDTIDNQLKYEEFRITGKIELTTLKSRVTHTFKKRKEKTEVINQLMSKDVPTITSKTKIGLNDMSDEYRYGHWCYDTPGTINDDQILNILTTNELTKTLPGKIISPRTFCMWADQTIFIAGLGRLDIVEASHFIRLTNIDCRVTHTFKKRKEKTEVINQLMSKDVPTITSKTKIGLNDMSDEYRYGHWCYDTPGTINDDQILNILTTNELTKTLPGKIISPRTFCMWADQTIFIAGLGRLDIVEASHFIRCTVFASEHLPITICKEKDAKEVYKKLIKTEAFTVPCNDHIRLKRWPELKFKEFEFVGVSQFESSSDIVLSSAGWIAIAASYDNIIRVKAWTPLARGIYLRSPSLLPKSVNFRGIRRVGSPAYQSGQQIYIN
ncbi:nitric oxide-associated protein 1 [Copidosoma floridanum]|uniref:nitric oxide-associated protein 1 n=1 Tax=Copidosoma floridanum TaxID=29053 RepID=UPI000C6FC7AA|nr:nitric oxide-associated protein 1 [Copidosoma floridanum]